MKEVFISYSSRNYRQAARLVKELNLAGISNWLAPLDLLPSENYAGKITEAIKDARIFVVLVSKDSQQSQQVLNEISIATKYRKEIIAFFLDSEPLNPDFEYYLTARHWIDAKTDHLDAIKKIVNLIHELKNKQADHPKSKEVEEAEKHNKEMLFMFVRIGVIMVSLIIFIILQFLIHSYGYGTKYYSSTIVIVAAAEILVIILLAAPIFGGSGKFAKQMIKEIINAFKGNQ